MNDTESNFIHWTGRLSTARRAPVDGTPSDAPANPGYRGHSQRGRKHWAACASRRGTDEAIRPASEESALRPSVKTIPAESLRKLLPAVTLGERQERDRERLEK